LWQAADKLRGNLDAAEYKHVVLGIIFLKYVSDAFEEKHAHLEKEPGADPEDKDEYLAENIFWVPKEARWSYLLGRAKQPTIGKDVDDAMVAIERDNPSLKAVLPKDYARPLPGSDTFMRTWRGLGRAGPARARARGMDRGGRAGSQT
jgi:type I restriction enzyme M protein